MKVAFGIALGLLALSSGTPACLAAEGAKPPATRFERADTDKSGDVSLKEFAAMSDSYIARADANNDGKATTAEIADEIMRARAERTAERLVRRFDRDGDGAISQAEIEGAQKARFDRLDRNHDGKLTADEMASRRKKPSKN